MQSAYKENLSSKQMDVFEKLLETRRVKNYTVKFSSGTAPGENFMGVITEAEVKWRDDGGNNLNSYFIIKCAPPADIIRTFLYVEDAFAREIYIYSNVLQEFARIQEEKRILVPFKSYPVFYQSMMEYKHEMLIFKNMKTCGFKNWKRGQPMDFDHTLLVMQEFGRLHALSYAIRDQKPAVFADIVKNTQEEFYRDFTIEGIRGTASHRFEHAKNALDLVKDAVVYDKFSKFCDNKWKVLINAIDSKRADKYAVVNHGDCGISNYLFKYDVGSIVPSQVCILDWQMSRLGSPALDLSYFLFGSTDKQLREQHYHNLIRGYYNSLRSFLAELGSDGEKLLPFEVLQEQLKKYSIFGLCMAIGVIYVQTSNIEEVPEMFEDESHGDGFSFLYELKDKSNFNERVRDAIIDFDRLRYDYLCGL